MKFAELIKNEIKTYKWNELIVLFLVLAIVTSISFLFKDTKIATINALCGILYTFFAGCGKVYCYFIGLSGTFCYCYLAYKQGFWGNFYLYALYYFPMQIIGIFKWNQHFNKEKNEIFKTKLTKKERIIYLSTGIFITLLFYFILKYLGGKNPFMDSFTTVFSVMGLFLTVKRCIEQWYVWIFVNLASFLMWLFAILNKANCVATLLMWGIYLFLAFYFLIKWNNSPLEK